MFFQIKSIKASFNNTNNQFNNINQNFTNSKTGNNLIRSEDQIASLKARLIFSISYFLLSLILFFLTLFLDVYEDSFKEKILYFTEKITSLIGLISILLFMKTKLEGIMLFSLFFLLIIIYKNQRACITFVKNNEIDHIYPFDEVTFIPLVSLHLFLSVINIFATWLYVDNFIILPVIFGLITFMIGHFLLLKFSVNLDL